MVERPLEDWESQPCTIAQDFPYPATPDLASSLSRKIIEQAKPRAYQRRLAWVIAFLLVLLTGLSMVPTVRARILEFLQIGSIRILLEEPTPTETLAPQTPTITSSPIGSTATPPSNTPTPLPTSTYSLNLLDLAGETTLAKARAEAGFPLHLPTYPDDLGLPDRIFLQDLGGPAVLFIWQDPLDPDRPKLALLELGPNTFAEKEAPPVIEETLVNGTRAVWMEGSHFLQVRLGYEVVRMVIDSNVLVWEDKGVTYRLETDLSLEQTVKISESLEP